MSSFNHNRKRNSGLVYEFLIRRMALSLVNNDKDSYSKALLITKKYFSQGMPLHREKEIFDVVIKSRGLNEQAARRVMSAMKSHCELLDEKKIDIKKSNLIKEINYTFGQKFFSEHRLAEYRLFASIQMLIDRYKKKGPNLSEDVQKIQLEEGVIKYMTMPATEKVDGTKGEKVDHLVATLAMRKFEERYSNSLSEGQKVTLRKFMNFSMTGNREQFDREMETEVSEIKSKLTTSVSLPCFGNDNVMMERLNEAISRLDALDRRDPESLVKDVLLYKKLVSEIDSNE